MTPHLAILIPTTPEDDWTYQRLRNQIYSQINGLPVTVYVELTEDASKGGPTTGAKRNTLLDRARADKASHVAFIDADDVISDRYFKAVMPGVYGDYDCCELWGQYYESGKQFNPFHHSIIHDHWWQDDKFYYRNPNHLNVIKLELLKDIRFQDKTIGEDGHFSIDIQKAGLLKKEYPVKEIIYYYFAGRRDVKSEMTIARNRGTTL